MRDSSLSLVAITVDEDTNPLTLSELCRACRVSAQDVAAWVDEAIVEPEGPDPSSWRFGAASLRRALAAARLSRDLQVASHDLGLVLDLMDEIGRLRTQLRRAGVT
jgi:chaperone modulatory protein CbpM